MTLDLDAATVAADTATVFDFTTEARRVRARAPREKTPDALLDDFRRSVRRALLADLATWPAAFQRALRDDIDRWTRGPDEARRADWGTDYHFYYDWAARVWFQWRRSRELLDDDEAPSSSPSSCACGCRGFNGEVGEKLRALRTAAKERRETSRPRAYGYRSVERARDELLETLWYHGRRRIDRGRLRQHAVESVRAELEQIEKGQSWESLRARRERLAETRRRLRDGVYLKGKRKGQPFTPEKRAEYEEYARSVQAGMKWARARVAELRAQLADPAALVREWTGCTRAAVGA